MVLRGADEFQGKQSTGSEGLHKLYCFLNMIMVMRFRWMGSARNVECVKDMRNVKEIKHVNIGTNEKTILRHTLSCSKSLNELFAPLPPAVILQSGYRLM
jgi:hypothetical protein